MRNKTDLTYQGIRLIEKMKEKENYLIHRQLNTYKLNSKMRTPVLSVYKSVKF